MKQITINGRFLARPMTGVDRYAMETLKAIDKLVGEGSASASAFDWQLAAPQAHANLDLKNIKVTTLSGGAGIFWEQVKLPLATRNSVLLNLCNSGPIAKRTQLVVIHDAATARVPDSYSSGFRAWYRLMIPTLLLRSQIIGTVSHFSRGELQAVYKTNRAISVLPEGAEHLSHIEPDPSIFESKAINPTNRPYVLAVGSLAPHKNFKVLIEAVSHLQAPPFDVVIAGGTNPKVFAPDQGELPSWVKHVGYVTDSQLKSLYQAASCFVFPSKYEGYGLPPTEAMALGCPVICARSASLPEVCGDAAIYFDPDSPHELASKLLHFFANAEIGARLRQQGLDNVRERTWRNAALAVIDAIKEGCA